MIACLLPEIATEDCALLPFLATPRRYTNSPLAQLELAYLRHLSQQRPYWWRWSIGLLLITVIIITSLPLYRYMRSPDAGPLLLTMLVVIYSVHVGVTIFTLFLANSSLTIDKQLGIWECLVLTHIDARQILLGKWWATLRAVWKWHFAASLVKVGMAYALTQFLHNSSPGVYGNPQSCYWPFSTAMCNVSADWQNGSYNPTLLSVVVATGVLILCGFADMALVTALGVLISLLRDQHRIIAIIQGFTARSVLLVVTVILWFIIAGLTWNLLLVESSLLPTHCPTGYEFTSFCPMFLKFLSVHDWRQLLETTQLSLSTVADGGTLLAANMMRPQATNFHLVYHVTVAAFGLGTYIFLLWATLRLAQFAAIRRGASRPIDT
jgi:hypothetical protein